MKEISSTYYHKRKSQEQKSKLVQEMVKDIDLILNCSDHKKFISYAEGFGKELKNKRVTTSQVRKIFTEVQKIRSFHDTEDHMRLHMLRPKLAYAKGRFPNLDDLQFIFDKLIRKINSEEQLKNFKLFFEAVLAYHKSYGGGD